MATTNFSYGTVIASTWLNDVDAAVYETLPTLVTTVAGKANTNSPTLVTPNLGVATATSINKNTFTTPATNCTWTLADGKTFTVDRNVYLTGTDSSSINITGTCVLEGSNRGDQNIFTAVKVAGQSDILATTLSSSLTIATGGGLTLTTNAGTKTLTITNPSAGAMVLLATLTPTASANIDFLNVFSSTYDSYLIVCHGIKGPGGDSVRFRFANAGVVDAGATYATTVYNGGSTSGASGTSGNISGGTVGTGGSSFYITVSNVNSTTETKTLQSIASVENGGTYSGVISGGVYVAANTVSGIRFFWQGGANFQAAGKIRVYGLANT